MDSDWPVSDDPIKQVIDRANILLQAGDVAPHRVSDVLADIDALGPRELVQFDERSRGYLSGVAWHRLPTFRSELSEETRRGLLRRRRSSVPEPTDAGMALWHVLGAVSGDGYERERAVRSTPLTPLGVRLLGLRCIDWVQQVRDMALNRLDQCPSELLVQALPLIAQLAAERTRGQLLNALIDVRLTDAHLRSARAIDDALTRRVVWQRLAARGVLRPDELREMAAQDPDVLVRAIAAHALRGLAEADRRALATILIDDAIGWIAAIGLASLVELDGPDAIVPALTARTAALRRAARDWARIRDVDARAVYLARMEATPDDALALVALAEMGGEDDLSLFQRMLADDRARVRAAGMRALARVDRSAGREAALNALEGGQGGRVGWTAAEVLRDGVPSSREAEALARVALDAGRATGQRFRAMALIRPARWLHLAVLLEAQEQAFDDEARARLRCELDAWNGSRLTRAPNEATRQRIERLLPTLDDHQREWVEFVLRTSS